MQHRPDTHGATEVVFRSEPTPGARYGSGLHFYDEQLVGGRLVGRYHTATGRVKYTQGIDVLLERTIGRRPVEAFQLVVDGFALSGRWRWLGASDEPLPDAPGLRHAVIDLAHAVRPVRVAVHTRLDGTAFMTRWLEITNTGAQPAALGHVAPWSGLLWHLHEYREHLRPAGDAAFTLGYSRLKQFGHEGDFAWQALSDGIFTVQNDNGRSGWGLPFFMARNEVTGASVIAHLAWSGNWSMHFRVDSTGDSDFSREGPPADTALFFDIAPAAPAPQRMIAPGETVRTPAVHLGYLQGDLDTAVQSLHAHLRRSVFVAQVPERNLLVGAARVVEGDEAWLRHEIDTAAEAGCDFFMIDAGWYGAKPMSWSTTVGDWNVGDWLPNGLAGLRDYVHASGMLFALWMEPESVGADSRLVREHPDWLLQRDGEPVARALDLSRDDVARWVEDEIVRVIAEHQPDMFKLDYNTPIFEAGQRRSEGAWENTLWRHYERLYAIFDRVRARFPRLVLENCASGGGRNDLGLASRFHISCLSDWTLPPRSLKALNNLTLALPPEQLRYYVGHIPGYHEFGDLDFQLRVPLFANPLFVGFGPWLEGMDPPQREQILRYITLYKQFMRPMLPSCRVFHHTPVQSLAATAPWCVLEYAAPDGARAYAGLFRLTGSGDPEFRFYARGLDPRRVYEVTFHNSGAAVEFDGARLAQEGLRVRLEQPLTSELLLFTAR